MTIKAGDKLPDATFKIMTADGPAETTTAELFSGKTVVLFAVPGAFTPTCDRKHLPSYVGHAEVIRSGGFDTVACMSVNDVFVMHAWGLSRGAGDKVLMLADGNGDYTEKLGLVLDCRNFDMGIRCKRFAMVVSDGVVESLELDDASIDALTVCGL